ncbi:PREDICTED: uncharacterized protein LOC105949701 isoform X2 [Erythranthe guttata]|uniref:uncharacterized protein LOC105949701 isoform X2 n=1 Tax=Erythranthe guttata TaxID=4155 RepID=UPI00064DCD1F|nr:PREDICTED: uncharacterized protein LOC105949701 isoform X2 [Erythranthe guttata]|eukprot:XP_012828487.1 PREDICTED: uncharacterized protein LOC105949701 isoform X2 [Erythranthe guttata]
MQKGGYVAVNKHYRFYFLFPLRSLFIFSPILSSTPGSEHLNFHHHHHHRRRPPPFEGEHEMVGLSVILENNKDLSGDEQRRSPQVISKGSMIKPPSNPPSPTAAPPSPAGFSRRRNASSFSPACGFLEYCFLCTQKLLPGKDIYIGDKAFCSEDCRCRQIFMDEEEMSAAKRGCTLEYNRSLAATSSSSSSPSSSSSSRSRKGAANRANYNAFAY